MKKIDILGTMKQVRFHRKALGIKSKEMAERVGISATYYSDIERGAKIPKHDLVHDMCNALGLKLIVYKEL